MKGKKKTEKTESQSRKIWDPVNEQIVDVDESGLYQEDAYIKTGAGQKDGMPRYYLVLVPKRKTMDAAPDAVKIETTARVIACLEFEHAVEVESFEAKENHILGSILIDPEVIPLDFIELLIGMCDEIGIELHPDHMLTNIEKPSDEQVQKFLKRTSL